MAVLNNVVAIALTAASVACGNAHGQGFPSKPLRIFVPGAAGSVPDVAARQVAEKLSPAIGQPVLVEDKPGAGGAIAMTAGAKSEPDGHTLVLATFTQLSVNPSMYEKLPYDPLADFAPVILVYRSPLLLVAHPTLPVGSTADLVRLAKAQPGRLAYASAGNGTPPHIFTELLKLTAGIDLMHVPYKGGPAAVTALLTGDVSVVLDGAPGLVPHVKAGKMKPLAVTGEQRLTSLPDVPTFTESGIPGIGMSWAGIVAPAATPRHIVGLLNVQFARALASAEVKTQFENAGRLIPAGSPEDFGALIRDELPKWREIVKKAGIKPG